MGIILKRFPLLLHAVEQTDNAGVMQVSQGSGGVSSDNEMNEEDGKMSPEELAAVAAQGNGANSSRVS